MSKVDEKWRDQQKWYDTVEDDVPQLDQVLSILPLSELLPLDWSGGNSNAVKMD